jgi:hypothetical protein
LDEKKPPSYWLAKIINPIVVKNTIDELKVYLLGRKTHIRFRSGSFAEDSIYRVCAAAFKHRRNGGRFIFIDFWNVRPST